MTCVDHIGSAVLQLVAVIFVLLALPPRGAGDCVVLVTMCWCLSMAIHNLVAAAFAPRRSAR